MRLVLVIGLLPVLTSSVVAAEGDPRRGQQLFQRACGACHSLKPDANMTGPSLFRTGTGWPDLIVAVIMASLALQGAVVVIRQAGSELQISRTAVPAE